MADLSKRGVLITGVGARLLEFVFDDIRTGQPTHTPIFAHGREYKANIGAATALECAKTGATVYIVARSRDKLDLVKEWIEQNVPGAHIECRTTDLSDAREIQKLIAALPEELEVDLVQSLGLGAGTVALANDNPYLTIDKLSDQLIETELSVLRNTVTVLQSLLPRFRRQAESRICVVSSMSAVRSVVSGSIHMAAKASISRFANAAMIELNKWRIFVTDVRPGIVDTGLYDNETVRNTVAEMGRNYGYNYSQTGIFCAPPSAVGQAIVTALASDAHITSINMVARGQWPHEAS